MNITAMLGLSIFLGILSIFNKVWLFQRKKIGWTTGMLIGLLSSVYFYMIDLTLLATAELGFFGVMLYGRLFDHKDTPEFDKIASVILSAFSCFIVFLFYDGFLTVVELISSVSFIWGAYLVATKLRAFGWVSFIIAHIATSYAAYVEAQFIFALCQVLSAIVCTFAAILPQRQPKEVA